MLRSLMVIWAVGATFFLAVLLIGNPPPGSAAILASSDIVAFAVLGMLSLGRDRLPRWTPDLCAYLLYVALGGIILTYQDPVSPYAFLYLWLAVHSFYFLPWRRALPQVPFIAVTYAFFLWAIPGPTFPSLFWAVTVLTAVVICTLVALLRARVDALVSRLREVARTDPLTGLRNRRAYDELIELEIARSRRTGRPFALVVGDLDHFKRVNDRFGHPTGDIALRRVAAELDNAGRRTDSVARLGGEEFALLFTETDADAAYVVAERVRLAITRAFRRDRFRMTMSFGIACFPDDGDDSLTLFQAADAALLAAKAKGRDRTVIYGRHSDIKATPPVL
jgi:diguanylate cyclase (GGDEF)-like protein